MSDNTNLHNALKNKNDEFFTRYVDVDKELENYKEYFEGKTVYLPCDNERSSFWSYFFANFSKLKLKRLIATSLGEPAITEYIDAYSSPKKWQLETDGNFLGGECQSFLRQCDIVVTNPPFSLYRQFVLSIIAEKKDFLLIGNENSVSAKEIFPLFKEEKIHYGYNSVKSFMKEDGAIQEFGNICWFTNLPIKSSVKFSPINSISWETFKHYDNYAAINIDKVKEIPTSCPEVMGVPITYLKKHNSERYEILGMASGAAKAHKLYGSVEYTPNPNDRGGAAMVDGQRKYTRIFIKERN